jgi:hypothetical protein
MLVTELGIVTLVKPEDWKALEPMLDIEVDILILVKTEQFRNALLPILVTKYSTALTVILSGITISGRILTSYPLTKAVVSE